MNIKNWFDLYKFLFNLIFKITIKKKKTHTVIYSDSSNSYFKIISLNLSKYDYLISYKILMNIYKSSSKNYYIIVNK
jgi:hypothetical protein